MSRPEKEKDPSNFDLHDMQLQAQQQKVSHQNVVDHPQPGQQQQFRDMPINITSSIGDLERCNRNQNSRNEALSSLRDQDPNHHQQRRSNFRRHSQEQIQEMEAFFEQCPLPNGKQRKLLSCVQGLTPMQIKFWFQNKRNQIKTQQELHQNDLWRDENEKLRAENEIYKGALKDSLCPNCTDPISIGEMSSNDNQLRIENARLKVEIEMFTRKLINNVDLVGSSSKIDQISTPAFEMGSGSDISSSMIEELYCDANDPLGSLSIPNDFDKATIVELVVVSMEELTMLTLAGSPLWISTNDTEILNEVEYLRVFPKSPKLTGLKSKSSRESVIVSMNHINLIDFLMDVSQWSTMFHVIVSKALTLEVLSPGVSGNYNGALQVMSADFQVPSPLVPARENYFVRYCKKHQEGIWAVVDVSLDHLRPSSSTMTRRRPSGCLIQELSNGCSKVTWVEHVEVDENTIVSNPFYKSLITSGLAFGAKRWVTSLDRQCERLACSMTNNIPVEDHCVVNRLQGRKNLLHLAEEMKVCFYAAVGSSVPSCWEVLTSDCDDVRVMTKTSIVEPGTPTNIVLSAGTSIWLPVLPRRPFDFLGSQDSRSEWDVLSVGGIIKEMEHITHGRDLGNYVSLFHVSRANCDQNNMVVLQDNSIDSTCSHVIYAPAAIDSVNAILNGGDPNFVALLPSGFVILPNRTQLSNTEPMINTVELGGCQLTISFQFLVDPSPTRRVENDSIEFAVKLVKNTTERIKLALVNSNT